ncbi:MAG: hypothetical protein KGI84_07740 [Elusimicrobia bacterium]|nr:hypothetical protein [Elusimicrobiota bacterium]
MAHDQKKNCAAVLTAALSCAMLAATAMAAFPSAINFQGRLTDASGNPITGTESIQFSIWNAATGGSQLWNETQSVTVSSGIYNVALGSVVALSTAVFSSGQTWLQIQVGADAAMTPRLQFQATPYAFTAQSASSAASLVYPDGTAGLTPVTVRVSQSSPYVVPSGDDFYFHIASATSSSGYLTAGGSVTGSQLGDGQMPSTFIAGPGTSLASSLSTTTYDLNGFLVPATVTAVIQDIAPGGTYTVPAGKTFYLMPGSSFQGCYSGGSILLNLTIGGISMTTHWGGNTELSGVAGSGQTITNSSPSLCAVTIDGYLK